MALDQFRNLSVIIRGGGDLASGVAYRLWKSGLPVLITELPAPLLVRRTVCFGEAVFSGSTQVEDISAVRVDHVSDAHQLWFDGVKIPVLVDQTKEAVQQLQPWIIIDGRMEKRKLDTTIQDAPLVIALGPGYEAGRDCHAVIETNRGHNLGRVIWDGCAEPDTGEPGAVQGQTHTRIIRAPADGTVSSNITIGNIVEEGQVIATVAEIPIHAAFRGILRGLIHPEVYVTRGQKIADIDPRAKQEHCFRISDKSLAVGGGVLEAVLSAKQVQEYLR